MAAANEYNRTSGMPFTLSFSVGVIRTDASKRLPVDECIRSADALMYKVKQKKKAAFTSRQPSEKPKTKSRKKTE